MLPSHKILVRYKTIDSCLRDSTKQWTLDMIVSACSKALGLKISKRSVQSDIHFMRNHVDGFGAPIVVKNKKYYSYSVIDYSILNDKVPHILEEQYKESSCFAKEITSFASHSKNDTSLTNNFNISKLKLLGYCSQAHVYSKHEVSSIINKLRYHNIRERCNLLKECPELVKRILLTNNIHRILKKITPKVALVGASFQPNQKNYDYQQNIKLPICKRLIPRNLTIWDYPTEEKYEDMNYKMLYEQTFIVEIYLKGVKKATGARQVIAGSHKRELNNEEIKLIANNSYPVACDMNKGGVFVYKPLLINKIDKSFSRKYKQTITLWYSSFDLPVQYKWESEKYQNIVA